MVFGWWFLVFFRFGRAFLPKKAKIHTVEVAFSRQKVGLFVPKLFVPSDCFVPRKDGTKRFSTAIPHAKKLES